MPKRIFNARTALGAGLGGATGLAVNRLILGNKSLLSNLIATGAGGALGGVVGYYLNRAANESMSQRDENLLNVASGNIDKSSIKDNKELMAELGKLADPEVPEKEKIEIRNAFRQVFSDAELEVITNSAKEARGTNDSSWARYLGFRLGGAAGGEALYQAVSGKILDRLLKGKKDITEKIVLENGANFGLRPTLSLPPSGGQPTVSIPSVTVASGAPGKGIVTYGLKTNQLLSDLENYDSTAATAKEAAKILASRKGYTNIFSRLFGSPEKRATANFIYKNAPKHAYLFGGGRALLRFSLPAMGALAGGMVEDSIRNYDPAYVAKFKKLGLDR